MVDVSGFSRTRASAAVAAGSDTTLGLVPAVMSVTSPVATSRRRGGLVGVERVSRSGTRAYARRRPSCNGSRAQQAPCQHSMLREQKCHDEAQAPVRSVSGCLEVVPHSACPAQFLVTPLRDL